MKISYNWLKQFIQIDWESQKTGELLTDLGLEVEGIEQFESVKGSLKGIVVGHVLTCVKHSNADKLNITTVDIGTGSPLQIVCGAKNVAVGQKVPVATIGTTLYTPEGEAWTIKKGKIRGEESHGMICAEDELGLGTSHDGIMVLNPDLIAGTPCSEIFDVELDEVFEIGLTPNRADAMSHFGVARDLKAGLKQKKISKELITPSTSHFNINDRSLKIDVDVKKTALAPRYCGVTISNLIIQPSPTWLQNRLRAIGLTPKNNVVDATNYVLHELGQPLHAFDAAKIKGNKIIVQTLAKGTKFVTLDGIERVLHEDDLMICDTEKPLCIAGVFGGIGSGVTQETTSIFLESAYFNPVSIRKSAKRHALNTDASFRFERGIDIENVEYSLKRAALLIKEIAGGDITSDVIDLYPNKTANFEVFLAFEKINKLIGQEIPQDTIKSILASLDIKLKNVTETGMGLEVPSYRVDVQRQVDVIEEILRVYGYNNITFNQKLNASIATTKATEDHKIQSTIGNVLAAKGYNEILTNSLTNPNYNKLLGEEEANNKSIEIINPLSGELSVLRKSSLFSALECTSYNINRKRANLKLFEFGKTYHSENNKRVESKYLSILLTGDSIQESWTNKAVPANFFELKTIVETILRRLGIDNLKSEPTTSALFAEGLNFTFKKNTLVSFGLIKKSILKHFDMKQNVLYADFHWDAILDLLMTTPIKFKEIPKYPEVKRDFALLLDQKTTYKELYDIAYGAERKFLIDFTLFDVYEGKNLPEGKKSYAVSFTLQDDKSTLTEKQIEKIMSKLQTAYETNLGASLR
ncbi:phenylalanine--tRNA ligase subunit beta [Maribacter hydrothermalis]|uniref:Phenylalanine--tRNA ligase beta subunit n=1 Tax=Maribacter hydrothermalis TaxID=1836467 RepID=A0A1B7Z844_9FLAO|nr:phenylalanine--tRNA ligase subunit beta [Maribacter hydrothermalis]APQ19127.1 phenylalanine--tRNA ligase subunit beta [Maribacter hydrothermalis]OBR38862.1 phenylalanine--tRNA ligase subunit beta [Maribacter hydrothermalis]